MMQAGFLCLESGLTRNKNATNVAIKNVADFGVAVALFWAFGFALMFGISAGGWVGSSHFLTNVGHGAEAWLAAFFLFQVMFCATAATIVSGAVAERMRFVSYLIVTALVAGLIYPVFGHWAWGGVFHGEPGWLAALGFVDFAGSTVVHGVGGWVALAAVLIIGPRAGRFTDDRKTGYAINAGNRPMAMLGGLLLFLGWFGFNGGSTFAFDQTVPGILTNTTLAAVSGSLIAMALGWRLRGYGEVVYALNGSIAGLVAITASAHAVSSTQAMLIGLAGGTVMVLTDDWLQRKRIDDAVGAVPAHLAAGIWGTVAVALFGDLDTLNTGLSRGEQLGVQIMGIVVCGAWAFGVAWIVLRGIDRWQPLRVSSEAERIGLNVSEHGAHTELQALLETMQQQQTGQDLAVRAPVEPFTEVGQIASSYNRVMDALERAVGQTRSIIRDIRDGVVTTTPEGLVRSLNPGAEELFDVAAGEAIGQPLTSLLGEHGIANSQGWKPGARFEFQLSRESGRTRVLEVSVSESALPGETLLTGMVRDVTERRRIQDEMQHQRELAEVTLASIGDAVITTDESGTVKYLNPVAELLTGWQLREARGMDVRQIFRLRDELTGDSLDNPARTVLAIGRESRRPGHALLIRQDGETIAVRDIGAPIRDRHGHLIGCVLVFHDVSATLQLTRELSHQASHDALTGVPNRREFERRLGALLGTKRLADSHHVLCYLDLDQFKVVNDTCGHVAGDELLRQVTALLRGRIRESDVLARLGGDEFGILFLNCPLDKAMGLAEGLRQSIQEFRFSWDDRSFAIGVSIGVVPMDGEQTDLGRLLATADTACYAAKEAGRNLVWLYRENDSDVQAQRGQMQWVSRIRQALDQDRLRLFVQPIVALEREHVGPSHYEILVRLEEDGELIAPGSFIPAAERYGLMVEIDQWVIGNTLSWLGDACRSGEQPQATFCINVSGASLSSPAFRQMVVAKLRDSNLSAGAVCLEITESAAIANLSKVVDLIRQLKPLGCTFALDDFGSGLSSFAYLKALPVDYLKIDGSFVRDLEHDPVDLAMVQAINTIGHTMELKTVAEFVESEAILERLREMGVDYAQGYHIGRPQPLLDLHPVRMMPR